MHKAAAIHNRFFAARGFCSAYVRNKWSQLWNDFGMSVRPGAERVANSQSAICGFKAGAIAAAAGRVAHLSRVTTRGPRGGCARRRLRARRVFEFVAHHFTNAPCCLCATVC